MAINLPLRVESHSSGKTQLKTQSSKIKFKTSKSHIKFHYLQVYSSEFGVEKNN